MSNLRESKVREKKNIPANVKSAEIENDCKKNILFTLLNLRKLKVKKNIIPQLKSPEIECLQKE